MARTKMVPVIEIENRLRALDQRRDELMRQYELVEAECEVLRQLQSLAVELGEPEDARNTDTTLGILAQIRPIHSHNELTTMIRGVIDARPGLEASDIADLLEPWVRYGKPNKSRRKSVTDGIYEVKRSGSAIRDESGRYWPKGHAQKLLLNGDSQLDT